MTPSHTLGAMKRAIFLTALMLTAAAPALAQSTEFGILFGGSRRFISGGLGELTPDPTDDPAARVPFLDNELKLSNSAIDLYWAIELEEDTRFKVKVGRIETPVAFAIANPNFDEDDADNPDQPRNFRRDVEGEVQHVSAVIEYRFDEPYGSTALFGGLGLYRQTGEGVDSENDYGFQVGLNADFPITRKYGVIVEGTYHWSRGAFSPRYLTLTGGLRLAF
jgi:hypothetical protein